MYYIIRYKTVWFYCPLLCFCYTTEMDKLISRQTAAKYKRYYIYYVGGGKLDLTPKDDKKQIHQFMEQTNK